jgi:hypothetical protein
MLEDDASANEQFQGSMYANVRLLVENVSAKLGWLFSRLFLIMHTIPAGKTQWLAHFLVHLLACLGSGTDICLLVCERVRVSEGCGNRCCVHTKGVKRVSMSVPGTTERGSIVKHAV